MWFGLFKHDLATFRGMDAAAQSAVIGRDITQESVQSVHSGSYQAPSNVFDSRLVRRSRCGQRYCAQHGLTAVQGNPRIPSADHRSHIFRAWGVMYRQAYPWRAARQQPADGDLVAEGEGLAFVCYSSDIAGARRCALSFTRAHRFSEHFFSHSNLVTGTSHPLRSLFPTRRNRGRHRSHVRRRSGPPPALATAHPNSV